MTSDDRVDADSGQYDAEIKLAERGFHVLMERVALKRMPADALPAGAVFDLLDAAGEQVEIDALQEKGEKVRKRRIKRAAARLKSAVERLADWPEGPRIQLAPILAETLHRVELDSLADDLGTALLVTESPVSNEPEAPAEVPLDEVPGRIRQIIESGEWTAELEDHLRTLRDLTLEDPDEDLFNLLNGGVVFNAVAGRKHLLLEERRRLAEAEPLSKELEKAFSQLPDDLVGSELVRLGLHLVLADVVAADLMPDKASPEITVAATLAAMKRLDEPGRKPDFGSLGGWTKANPLKLDVQSDEIAPVFEWEPPDHQGSLEPRHEQRWRVESLMFQFLPARWVPGREEEKLPYSAEKARERLEELRDVAWLMVDEIEPVRFVSEAFRYGDGAPEALDLEIVRDAISLWKEQALVSAIEDFGRAYLEDEWKHEIPDDQIEEASEILPTFKTSDGEPLILSTVIFGVAEATHDEIVEHLDAADGFRRERVAGGDCWAWLGPSSAGDKIIADLTLEDDILTVQAHSLARASRANSALVEELGDLIVLKDIRTQEPTPEMLAELGIEPTDEEEAETRKDDQMRVVHEVLERHYRKWLYEPLPALDDATPRDAVTDPVTRAEVIKLLLEAEERTRASSWPMCEFDFDFLWSELGLSRDEAG